MAAPNWRTLRVEVNDRAAIYAEAFPSLIAAAGPTLVTGSTHDQAQYLCWRLALPRTWHH